MKQRKNKQEEKLANESILKIDEMFKEKILWELEQAKDIGIEEGMKKSNANLIKANDEIRQLKEQIAIKDKLIETIHPRMWYEELIWFLVWLAWFFGYIMGKWK